MHALNQTGAYVFVKDENRYYRYLSDSALNAFGLKHIPPGLRDEDVFSSKHYSSIKESDLSVLEFGLHIESEEGLIIDTIERRFIVKKSPIYSASGKIIGVLGVSTDVTVNSQLQSKIQKQSRSDQLTRVFNRRHFFETSMHLISMYKRKKVPFCVIGISLDNFKELNNEQGNFYGDMILEDAAYLIKKQVREYDIVSRISGIKFAILLPDTQMEQALLLRQRIMQSLKDYDFDNSVRVHPSFAAIEVSKDINTADDIFDKIESKLKL
ncbi:GGDEF domain-containing protein [Alginatibacterium sediminis]|uniref:GGDEF domain-containing protein n=1 Tax=Alginatibacterium sediminis TaxID=2164068 RepID=A0A420E685_9ALTE|nr:GGDEF domain-containing protein [Alginatibacterium sediminis]RKF13248.1 GGDEF domain-containing protein [Alginatibacterium sediminis]